MDDLLSFRIEGRASLPERAHPADVKSGAAGAGKPLHSLLIGLLHLLNLGLGRSLGFQTYSAAPQASVPVDLFHLP
jgi:hypothetical protein